MRTFRQCYPQLRDAGHLTLTGFRLQHIDLADGAYMGSTIAFTVSAGLRLGVAPELFSFESPLIILERKRFSTETVSG